MLLEKSSVDHLADTWYGWFNTLPSAKQSRVPPTPGQRKRETVTLETHPLKKSFGVEVRGVDVRAATESQIGQIKELLDSRLVLLFRAQHLNAEEQVQFASSIGQVSVVGHASPDVTGVDRYVVTNANRPGAGKTYINHGEMWLHFDQAELEMPIAAGLLYALEVTSSGGHTLFANAAAAYERLPDDIKRIIDGLEAENVWDRSATTEVVPVGAEWSSFVHPVVTQNPTTGAPSLFVSPLMTRRIVGLPEAEGAALLRRLYAHIQAEDCMYGHEWRRHDLVMWDNRTVLHGRSDFDDEESRVLRRASIVATDIPRRFDRSRLAANTMR